MLASKLICYLSNHPAGFGFWSSTPRDNITWLLLTGRLLSLYQICRLVLVLLLMSLLTQSSSSPTFLILFSLYPILREALYLCLKCMNYMTFWTMLFPNKLGTHILVHVFNSVSRQHCEVWASQFPFLHSLRDVIPPNEACLYGHINWCLAQAQQQSSMGLSQSFPSKRGGKTRPWTGIHFTVQKRLVPWSSGPSLANRCHFESGNEAHPNGKKSAGGSVSTSSTNTRRKGVWGSALLMCHALQPPHHVHM